MILISGPHYSLILDTLIHLSRVFRNKNIILSFFNYKPKPPPQQILDTSWRLLNLRQKASPQLAECDRYEWRVIYHCPTTRILLALDLWYKSIFNWVLILGIPSDRLRTSHVILFNFLSDLTGVIYLLSSSPRHPSLSALSSDRPVMPTAETNGDLTETSAEGPPPTKYPDGMEVDWNLCLLKILWYWRWKRRWTLHRVDIRWIEGSF